MAAHQLRHLADGRRVVAQALEDRLCHSRARNGVARKMPDQVLIKIEHLRLCNVMQQCRKAHRLLRLDIVQHVQRVLPDVHGVMRIVLHKADAVCQLRNEHAGDVRKRRQNPRRATSGQKSGKLLAQTLARNRLQPPAQGVDGRGRFRGDGKAEARSKAQPAQHPQRILGKALRRPADAADHARGQIVPAAEEVDHPPLRVRRHRVDGKIPAQQITAQFRQEGHRIRVAAVGIAGLRAEGRDLIALPAAQHRDRAEALACQNHTLGRKAGRSFLRLGARANIPVLRRFAAQTVADAAADGVGRKARRAQTQQ